MLIILQGKIIGYHMIQFIDISEPNEDATVDVVNKDGAGNVLQILATLPDKASAETYIHNLSEKLLESDEQLMMLDDTG